MYLYKRNITWDNDLRFPKESWRNYVQNKLNKTIETSAVTEPKPQTGSKQRE